MDIRIRSGRTSVLLLVDGRVVGIFIQFLGDNLSIRISRNQRTYNYRVVLFGLFCRFSVFDRYSVSFSHRLFGRWCIANGLHEIATALHEFDDILY